MSGAGKAEIDRATQQAVDAITTSRDRHLAQIDAVYERAKAERDRDWITLRRFLRAVGR